MNAWATSRQGYNNYTRAWSANSIACVSSSLSEGKERRRTSGPKEDNNLYLRTVLHAATSTYCDNGNILRNSYDYVGKGEKQHGVECSVCFGKAFVVSSRSRLTLTWENQQQSKRLSHLLAVRTVTVFVCACLCIGDGLRHDVLTAWTSFTWRVCKVKADDEERKGRYVMYTT